jgi:hypothetical protein
MSKIKNYYEKEMLKINHYYEKSVKNNIVSHYFVKRLHTTFGKKINKESYKVECPCPKLR